MMSASTRDMLIARDVCAADPKLIGGKAAGLARLHQLGVRCPEFFVVTASAFRAHLRKGQIAAALGETMLALADGGVASAVDLVEVSARLRTVVELEPLDVELASMIEEATVELGPGPYAVRSSMVGEDSTHRSFAGLLQSQLFQPTCGDVLGAVQRCWASAFSERVLSYALRAGLSPIAIHLGVVVQQMVDAEVAGVAFSANPLSGRRDECLITATFGLGEGVVEDLVAVDEFVWSAGDGERSARVATKDHKVVRARSGRGTERQRTSVSARAQRALDADRVAEVGTLVRRVAAEVGYPVDLEWAFADGVLHAVQARPITSLPDERNGTPVRVLDNSNIQESFNGVTTPLTFSFASRVYATVFSNLLRALGASRTSMEQFEPASRTLLATIAGRVYYNLESWRALYQVFPGGDRRIEEVETVMWHTKIGSGPSTNRSLAQRIRRVIEVMEFSLRLAWGFARMDREMRGFFAYFQHIYGSIDRRKLPEQSIVELYEISRRLQTELLRRWHVPTLNDFRVIMLCGHLRRLLGRFYSGSALDARLADLLGGIDKIESVEPTRLLVAIAQAAQGDQAVVTALRTMEPTVALERVRACAPAIADQIDDYLERYGDRTIGELKLETVTARDDPAFVVGILTSYLDRPTLDPDQLTAAERERYRSTLAELERHLPPWLRPLVRREIALARKAVHSREALRLRRTLAFGLARDVYGAMGVRLHETRTLDDPRDVFYLTVDELEGFVEGRAVSAQLASLINVRKQEWKAYSAQEPAGRLEVVGSPYIGNDLRNGASRDASANEGALRGLGCCGGVVEAPVRLVHQPQEGLGMNGEILCTLRTDPGWAPLFFTASGLIVERGSALSHSAILARELGLPTVVDVPGVTRLLRDGERVRLDGGTGVIERLESESVDAAPAAISEAQ